MDGFLSGVGMAWKSSGAEYRKRKEHSKTLQGSDAPEGYMLYAFLLARPRDFFKSYFRDGKPPGEARQKPGDAKPPEIDSDVKMSILLGGLPEDMTGYFGGPCQPRK